MAKKRYEIIATAFDKKGRIIGAGVNCYTKSHPLMKIYAERAGESELKIYQHAELRAILDAGNREVHSMLIQRFDRHGEPALAMPCPTCHEMLKDFGLKFVQYTSPQGIQRYNFV